MPRPRKVEFPVNLETMLRLARCLHNKRPEDRFKFYRMFVREDLFDEYGRYPTDEEIEAKIAQNRKRFFTKNEFKTEESVMEMFLPKFQSELRSKRAKKGSKVRWEKEK
jgi:hypothetical protein